MNAKSSADRVINPNRRTESTVTKRNRPYGNSSVYVGPFERLRILAYQLPAEERGPVLEEIRQAEKLTRPPVGIAYSAYPDVVERRRRALLPRPNAFYPGAHDYAGSKS
jgi:hypothetical protein